MAKKKRVGTHLTLPDGQRMYLSAADKKALKEKVLQAQMRMAAGVRLTDDTTFEQFAELWLQSNKVGKLRESSLSVLQTNLRLHVMPAFKGMRLQEIKPMHVSFFLKTIAPLSKSVQHKCLGIAKQVFRCAVDNGLIYKSPVTDDHKEGGEAAKEEQPLTPEQSKRLLEAVRGTRAELLVWVALTTGLRRGELIGLQWEDVDLLDESLTVRHNKSIPAGKSDAPVTEFLKTEAAHRTIPLDHVLCKRLMEAKLKSTSPFVFCMEDGRSLTKPAFRALWRIIDSRTADEGHPLGSTVSGSKYGPIEVTLDFSVHPHQLRHTCITRWLESGMDVKQIQYLAGHSTLAMTMRYYAHYQQTVRSAQTRQQAVSASAYLYEAMA